MSVGASRMFTRDVLSDKVKRLEQRIKSLNVLIDEIDWDHLTSDQETLLWSYFIDKD